MPPETIMGTWLELVTGSYIWVHGPVAAGVCYYQSSGLLFRDILMSESHAEPAHSSPEYVGRVDPGGMSAVSN